MYPMRSKEERVSVLTSSSMQWFKLSLGQSLAILRSCNSTMMMSEIVELQTGELANSVSWWPVDSDQGGTIHRAGTEISGRGDVTPGSDQAISIRASCCSERPTGQRASHTHNLTEVTWPAPAALRQITTGSSPPAPDTPDARTPVHARWLRYGTALHLHGPLAHLSPQILCRRTGRPLHPWPGCGPCEQNSDWLTDWVEWQHQQHASAATCATASVTRASVHHQLS